MKKPTLATRGLKDSICFLGARPHDDPEISEAYFAADVHVFPVQDRPGDNEGFGMVAIEAAAHGLPTVAYDAGGVSDAVSVPASGGLVASGMHDRYASAITCVIQAGEPSGSSACDFAAEFTLLTCYPDLTEVSQ